MQQDSGNEIMGGWGRWRGGVVVVVVVVVGGGWWVVVALWLSECGGWGPTSVGLSCHISVFPF